MADLRIVTFEGTDSLRSLSLVMQYVFNFGLLTSVCLIIATLCGPTFHIFVLFILSVVQNIAVRGRGNVAWFRHLF